jgi:hypothetical protein
MNSEPVSYFISSQIGLLICHSEEGIFFFLRAIGQPVSQMHLERQSEELKNIHCLGCESGKRC